MHAYHTEHACMHAYTQCYATNHTRSHNLSSRSDPSCTMGIGCFPANPTSFGWAICYVRQGHGNWQLLHSRRLCSWRRFPVVCHLLLRLYEKLLEEARAATIFEELCSLTLPQYDPDDNFDVDVPWQLTRPDHAGSLAVSRNRSRSHSRGPR